MTATTKARSKRASVPAVDPASSSTSALDALATTPGAPGAVRPVLLAALHPHPHNPRRDLGDLTELADSIRAHGVRQNLLLVPDPGHPGEYRIVIGHRRAAAAADAGLEYVPAVVDEHLTDADQLELMLLENLQRTDLTPVEEADGYQGLLDLGLDVAAIAQRTGRSASTVRARLKIAALPEPAREKVHTHQATIDDALALADFDGPEDLREELTAKLGEPGFAHALEFAKRTATEREQVADLRAQLEADGVAIVESLDGATRLHDLAATEPTKHTIPASLTPEQHRECPGHVAVIVQDYWGPPKVAYACTDWKANGHHKRYGAPSGQAAPERREVVAKNRAGAAAEVVRRQWIRDFLQRSKLPADAVVYVARIIRPGQSADYRESGLARDLLYGGKQTSDRDVDDDRSTPAGAVRHLVALAAARVEASMGKDFWRVQSEDRRIHLEQLAAWGYELADVERDYLKKKRA